MAEQVKLVYEILYLTLVQDVKQQLKFAQDFLQHIEDPKRRAEITEKIEQLKKTLPVFANAMKQAHQSPEKAQSALATLVALSDDLKVAVSIILHGLY